MSDHVQPKATDLDHNSNIWRALTDVSSDVLLLLDCSLSIAYVGGALTQIFGIPAQEILGSDALSLVHPDDRTRARDEVLALKPGVKGNLTPFRVVLGNNIIRTFSASATNLFKDQNVEYLVLALSDITTTMEAAAGMQRRDQDYRRLVEVTSTPILISLNETIVFANFAAVSALEAETPDAIVGTKVTDYIKGYTPWDKPEELHLASAQFLSRIDGSTVSAEFSTVPVMWEGQMATQIMIREVDKHQLAEMNLVYKATHDPLTGLPNRSLMLDRLELAGARSQRTQRHYSVLFIDLDRFKAVNDNYGHDIGDELLIQVSRRLLESVRPGDTVARLGGDEFVVLVEDLQSPVLVELVVQRIHRALATPFHIFNYDIFINSSIGVLVTTENPGPHSLLQCADAAMYAAKRAGRGQAVWFDSSMLKVGSRHQENLDQIKTAIRNNEVVLALDELVNLVDGYVEAVEAVFLWDHPTQGYVDIDELIGRDGEENLIVLLGVTAMRLVEEALEAGRELRAKRVKRGHPLGWMSGTVSSVELLHPNFRDGLLDGLKGRDLEPGLIALQVSEDTLEIDPVATKKVLVEAQRLGVRIILDDFCDSSMSLRLLRELRPDLIKLDSRCIRDLVDVPDTREFVGALIQTAHALGIRTIAKGVQSDEQLEVLVELGCDLAQGPYFGSRRILLPDGSSIPVELS